LSRPLKRVRQAVSARQVYGKPIERDGVTLVPAAFVVGGGGGGSGTDPDNERQGSGMGFGLIGIPVGAYEIRDDGARWRPVVDINRILAAFVLIAVLRALIRALR
jgi:uncharacterized spore protein YtfJ